MSLLELLVWSAVGFKTQRDFGGQNWREQAIAT